MHALSDSTTRHAVRMGKLWVNVPALLLLLGPLAAIVIADVWLPNGLQPRWLVALILTASWVLAWLWWSVAVPRWQVWAMRRAANLDDLMAQAIAAKILWSTDDRFGRFCAGTAWWTAALRDEAAAILAARRKGTPPETLAQ